MAQGPEPRLKHVSDEPIPPLEPPEPSLAERLRDEHVREAARAALAKRSRGERLTKTDISALERVQASEQERIGVRFARALPKRLYVEWSGRQTKILHEQADKYALPLRGATIDLAALVRALHDLLAEYAPALSRQRRLQTVGEALEGDPDLVGVDWADKVLEEKYYALRDARLEREGQYVPIEAVHQVHLEWAARLQQLGQAMLRSAHLTGAAAHQMLDDALDDCERVLSALDDDHRHPPPDPDQTPEPPP